MTGYYTETHYENAVLELVNKGLGYEYFYGPDVIRDYRSPLYDVVLADSLRRINKGLPNDAIQEALYRLKNFDAGSLVQKNTVFMDYLQNGILLNTLLKVKNEPLSSILLISKLLRIIVST